MHEHIVLRNSVLKLRLVGTSTTSCIVNKSKLIRIILLIYKHEFLSMLI
jgi:hypothetical protein